MSETKPSEFTNVIRPSGFTSAPINYELKGSNAFYTKEFNADRAKVNVTTKPSSEFWDNQTINVSLQYLNKNTGKSGKQLQQAIMLVTKKIHALSITKITVQEHIAYN